MFRIIFENCKSDFACRALHFLGFVSFRLFRGSGFGSPKPAVCCLLFYCISVASGTGLDKVADLIRQGDAQVSAHQVRAAFEIYQKANGLAPDRPELLLRISQQSGELIAEARSSGEARHLAEISLADAKRAVELEPRNAKAHLCLAIAYGRMTDFTNNRVKIEYSKLIRDETLISIALDPGDEYAWHVMGRWHAGIAGLNPVLKFLTRIVYGGLPDANYGEAARYLKKATEIAPHRILHHQELAKVYVALGRYDLAEKEWHAVLKLPVVDDTDEKARSEAKQGLKK